MIKEMEFLQKSIKYVQRLDTIKPKKDEAYDGQRACGAEIKKIKPKLDAFSATLDAMSEEFKASKVLKEENKEELDKLEEGVQEIKAKIDKVKEDKAAVKEEYYHKLFDFEVEKED